ncbi:AAA family ATPase [Spongiactinospora sp. TRM90649]|uniref:AAA family ATPase n=1 Tax=Spongiactinospora sp. TRM90649 TaxID=3031114 RepID=UPI0023F81A51|nr:AAA family ATPase [Spongiactinospora sp. TRM90649]MDF5755743.1 AAA family ATPase [Spongiactinospora sp. TRM90649]
MARDGEGLRALSLGVATFAGERWPDLPAAVHARACADLRAALAGLGYTVAGHDDPTASALGRAVHAEIGSESPGPLVVHVSSHGEPHRTGALYVVGSDGAVDDTTEVTGWLRMVERRAGRPRTLFLIDTCHAGQAARPPWLSEVVDGGNHAWVIAATGRGEAAYDARLTRAAATVLGGLGALVYADRPYVPFGLVVESIRAEVRALGGHGGHGGHGYEQRVAASPIDGDYPDLPFFPNPGYGRAAPLDLLAGEVDPGIATYLDDVVDPRHWLDRTAGTGPLTRDIDGGCFVGRRRQLRELTAWLDDAAASPPLRVVTGGPGAGKSALLGVLVCAAHPALRAATAGLRAHITELCPALNRDLAAVHARQRDLPAVTASIAGQLGLAGEGPWTPSRLLEALAARPRPATIVVDALDEATDPTRLTAGLLLPLAGGVPGVRLLVGGRPGAALEPLAALGEVTDLDLVAPGELTDDLRDYVARLLEFTGGHSLRGSLRTAFAGGLAGALASDAGAEPRWGPFLVAGLYTYQVVRAATPAADPAAARALGEGVPRALHELFRLDLRSRPGHAPWLLPLLTAVSHARGQGMPLRVLARLAPVWKPGHQGEATMGELLGALGEASFYLRRSPDTDGTALYRIYHQGLANHLAESAGGGADVLEAVLGRGSGSVRSRGWEHAEPYLLRHAVQHAEDAGAAAELLGDASFLAHADPAFLLPALDRLRLPGDDRRRRLARAVYRTSAHRHRDLPPPRRAEVLAVDAARWGSPGWASALSDQSAQTDPAAQTGPSARTEEGRPRWRPVAASGSSLTPAHRATLTGHEGRVNALATGFADGRPSAVTAGDDQTVRLWDLAGHAQRGLPMRGHRGPVTGVALTAIDGTPVAVSTGADGTVRLWDLPEGRPRGAPLEGHLGPVQGLAVTEADGRPLAVTTGADGTVRLWDLAGHRPDGLLRAHVGPSHAVACAAAGRRPVAVSTGMDGTVWMWDLVERVAVGHLPGPRGLGTAVCGASIDGEPAVLIADVGGAIRVWPLVRPAARPAVSYGRPVRALHATDMDGVPVVIASGDDHAIRAWDLRRGEPHGDPFTGQGVVTAIGSIAVDGRPLAVTSGGDGTVRVWDLDVAGPVGRPLSGHSEQVNAVAAARSGGPLVLTGGDDRVVRAWRPGGRLAPEAVLPGHEGPVLAAACLPDRPLAVTASADGTLLRWNLDPPTPIGAPLIGHTGPVLDVAATVVDGRPVAVSVSQDRSIRLWDLTEDEPEGEVLLRRAGRRHLARRVVCVAAASGSVAVTPTYAGKLRIWGLSEGGSHETVTVWPDGTTIRALAALEAGGRSLVVASGAGGSLGVLDLDTRVVTPIPPEAEGGPVRALSCAMIGGVAVAVAACGERLRTCRDLLGEPRWDEHALPAEARAVALEAEGRLLVALAGDLVVFRAEGVGADG